MDRLLRQVVPPLEALVAIAIRRDAIHAEAVKTEALRRSDDLKTALLRSVDKLLDLSRLQSGRAESQPEWISIEELLLAAREALPIPASELRLSVGATVPPVRADAAQLQQAFSNLLENARRYSNGRPVSVVARRAAKHCRAHC